MVRKKFVPKMGKVRKKSNLGGGIYRLRLIGDKKTVEDQQKWYKKRKIETVIRKEGDEFGLWVNER